MNKIKRNKTKHNKIKRNKTKHNKIKSNKIKRNKTKHNKIKRNKIKRNKTKNKYCLNGGNMEKIQPLLTELQKKPEVLPVQLSSKNELVVICKKINFTNLCNYIEMYLEKINIIFEKRTSINTIFPYVWFFHGNEYVLRDKRKDNFNFYSISVEYDECFKIEIAIQTYLTKSKNNLFVLNIFGNIVFHLLLKYSTHDNDLNKYYDDLYDKYTNTFKVDEPKLIQFLQDTNNIFSECHIYYRSISSNILKDMLQYFNPKISNVKPIRGVENIGNYNDIEQELNALCLEISVGTDIIINLRCILNMIILIINYTILDDNTLGICTKSGGEVYRYYGYPITYTNDIDTKIFYSLNSVENIQKIQEQILELLIRLTYYIKKFEHINNMIKRLNEKYILFGGLLIKLSFKSFKGNVDTRVRSKLISDIRLFSLDVFIGITFEINKMDARNQEEYIGLIYKENNEDIETDNKTSANSELFFREYNQRLYSFDSYMVTSPLDIANISTITSQQALDEKFIEYVDKMPILSKQYLIHDIEYLLTRTEREGKRQKDEDRLQFLKENLGKPIQNIEQLNICVQYYDKWMKYLLEQTTDINTYVQNQITQFRPTLVEGSIENYKTPLFYDKDNDDKFDLFQ